MIFSLVYLFPLTWIIYMFERNKLSIKFLFNKPKSFKYTSVFQYIFIPAIFGIGCLLLVLMIISYFNPNIFMDLSPSVNQSNEKDIILRFISVVIFAPIVEEIVFRGFLLHRLAYKFGLPAAIVLSSITFGILHIQNVFGAIIIGFVYCVIYVQTESLIAPILIHFIWNLLTGIKDIVMYMPEEVNVNTDALSSIQSTENLVYSTICVLIGCIWFIMFLKKNWRGTIKKGLIKL
ncbi:CPBP family intramembrane glutamic endopeptidase [Bacillus pacificus]|uniref:CPBP family intramembrane glutamic endopeptidase n=1 Tax=Bacillus TaxID=1386 RepID=UPI0022281411|nr:CPBP family intramembrane glutamic endopeptidase [Bacillus sp. ZJS3]